MDIQALQAFAAVAETESFSRAAEQLFLTQPAISKRIATLESLLDCRLFDRIGRRVQLTEAGLVLLPRARRILLELQDTRRLLSNLSDEIAGQLTLATSHHISLHRLPPVLRALRQSNPAIELDIDFTESELAYDAVLHGQCELAIITLAPNPHPAIESTQLWQDRLRYVIAKERQAEVAHNRLDALAHIGAILPSSQTFTRQLAERHFHDIGLNLQLAIATNNFDTIRMLVASGYGWSLLPETLIDDRLAVLELEPEPITRPLGYIRHRERTLSNAARALIKLLKINAGHNSSCDLPEHNC